ncbi:hypothetical protein GQ457_14G011470 [Hibiscus cannabinus]
MVETNKTTPPPVQAIEPPTEIDSSTPSLEDRVLTLENSIAETNGYLQRILSVLQKSREVVELGSPPKYSTKASHQPRYLGQKTFNGHHH